MSFYDICCCEDMDFLLFRLVKKGPFGLVFTILFIFLVIAVTGCSRQEDQARTDSARRAEDCYRSGDYFCAASEWGKIADQGKADAYVYEQLGNAYKKLGNLPAALGAFEKSVQFSPENVPVLEKKAELEIFFADTQSASQSLKQLEKLGRSSQYYVLSGDLLCLQGKYAEAEEKYRTVLSIEKDNLRALARLSFCLLYQGREKESQALYEKLVRHGRDKAEIQEALGRYWQIRGDLKKAEHFLKHAAVLEPDNMSLRVRLGQFYVDTGQYSKAHAIFAALSSGNPENTFAKKMLIETSLLAGDIKSAEKELESISADEKKELEFAVLDGKYNLLMHNLPQAVSCFQQALEQEPDLVVAHYLLGVTYLSMGHGNLGKNELIKALTLDHTFCDAELALAGFFYKQGKYDIAAEYANRVKEKEPYNPRAFLLAGAIHIATGNLKQAAVMYRTAETLNPELESPEYYGAVIAASVPGAKEAEAQYRRFLKECPECLDAVYDYAMLLVTRGETKAAEQFISKKISHDPDNPWLHVIAGEVLVKLDDDGRAIEAFKRAVELLPDMSYGYRRLIALMSKEPSRQKQLETLLVAAASRETCSVPDVYLALSRIYASTGREKQAIEILEQAKARMPGNVDIVNNLAWYYLMPGTRDVSRAFALAIALNEQFPDRTDVMDTLAWVYYFKEMYTQAHWLLEACLERGDKSPVIHYHLGMVYAAEKRFDDARRHLLMAQQSSQNPYISANLSEIKATLEEIGREEEKQRHSGE